MSIQPFDFRGHQVRVITAEDGEPRFVLNDLCSVLGLTNPSVVARRIDPDALSRAYPIPDAMGREQHPTVVDEAGMYEVILRSDKPEAAEFRRWVTREVLPAIRRTGSYGAPAAPLSEEEVVHQALQITYRKVQELEAKAAEDAPKVAYHDEFVCTEDLLSFRTVASTIGIPEKVLREALIEHGWIYRQSASRRSAKTGEKVITHRYSEYADKKAYFQRREVHDAPRFRGELMHTLKITPAGAEAINRAWRKWNQAAQTELGVEQ